MGCITAGLFTHDNLLLLPGYALKGGAVGFNSTCASYSINLITTIYVVSRKSGKPTHSI